MRAISGSHRQPSSITSTIALSVLTFSLSAFFAPPAHAASVPSAPQYMEAMAGTTQVAVTWDAPSSNGGESNLNYVVRVWSVPPPTSSPSVATCTTNSLGCIASGLVAGNTYYVDVIAYNTAGPSTPSTMKLIYPGNAGNPPTNISASRSSSGQVTVRWTPPASTGQGKFAWYTAEAFTGPEISAGNYSGFCTESSAAATSCSIGGLKSGVTYYVQVRAVSSLGSTYPSWPRVVVEEPKTSSTTTGVLTAPTSVKVTALSKSVKVSWRPPASTGGKTILSYRAGAFGPAGTLLSYCKTSPQVFSCTIKGLKSSQLVAIGVVAVYAGVDSPSSKLVSLITKK